MDGSSGAYAEADSHIISTPAVAWGAIIAGALAAAGIVLVLTPLGAAFGIAWSSPWNHTGEFGRVFPVLSAIWLIAVQWLSSGFGGYLTGRLRTKWQRAHTHEVFFRDTAHGFLSWALASVLGALLLVSIATHTSHAVMSRDDASSYFTDSLFRNNTTSAGVTDQDRTEARRILAIGVLDGQIPENDRSYLVELISSRTGMTPADANVRVEGVLAQEKIAVHHAAKASLFICLSLLVGALIASAAAALGGMHRDVHYEHGRLRI